MLCRKIMQRFPTREKIETLLNIQQTVDAEIFDDELTRDTLAKYRRRQTNSDSKTARKAANATSSANAETRFKRHRSFRIFFARRLAARKI